MKEIEGKPEIEKSQKVCTSLSGLLATLAIRMAQGGEQWFGLAQPTRPAITGCSESSYFDCPWARCFRCGKKFKDNGRVFHHLVHLRLHSFQKFLSHAFCGGSKIAINQKIRKIRKITGTLSSSPTLSQSFLYSPWTTWYIVRSVRT
jgi:hypothetical protein